MLPGVGAACGEVASAVGSARAGVAATTDRRTLVWPDDALVARRQPAELPRASARHTMTARASDPEDPKHAPARHRLSAPLVIADRSIPVASDSSRKATSARVAEERPSVDVLLVLEKSIRYFARPGVSLTPGAYQGGARRSSHSQGFCLRMSNS